MATVCSDVINVEELNDNWSRMANELLQQADIKINGSRPWDIQVHHADFFKRVFQQGSLGFGESYMDGWWDCDRLDVLFYKILKGKLDKQMPGNLKDILRIAGARLFNLQSRRRSWIVGKEHYDIGNDLFARMLDPHMQYSCAYWREADTLEQAQNAKLKMICEKLQLKPGMRLLDIGCGWGGLAAYAAQHYGVSVDGVTISQEQQKMAQQRGEGLDITILLQDYRDLDKTYDRIVSVGMFEHVGPKNYDTYFSVVDRCLKKDGLFLLHTIGSNESGVNVDPWINKYIFPNGCLPSIRQIASVSEKRLIMEDWHNFGSDYDKTLMAWHQRFNDAWPELALRYTPRFRRMFNYYLCACAGAFRARDIELWQVLFSRGKEGGMYVYR
ncbi:TPA: cyclopropane fatty acyl phospholipid synthase [Kluyvera georgiana]|uniref:cyclopropane fatty acyl phospholipid synthase n=1 Tax=Kluyvera georgiana TaxID=73098 RepID=UPI000807019A|nr:cyclopropane fatty acyl phospholipid synthase [Kluyvera georgiana]MDA8494941.1 cyclopropane fatty acyl phospholipid synthase [Kluyvera georgiana]HDG1692887.1 cyclopropane fatty acyl phospholipid synthase [Kluyvera georgiana]HED1418728.1 cyclopropane fatty acyl phospholipid synthase [Kluyvera georgiana]